MSLTTEQITEILFKVTGVSPGLFQETGSRKLGVIEAKTFYCDTEGEDYTCMIKGGQVYEIKNDSNTWNEEYIKHMTAPRPAAQAAPQQGAQLHQAVMPPVFGALPLLTLNLDLNLLKQAAADYVNLNPGCVSTPLGTALNEQLLHVASAWEVDNIYGGPTSIDITIHAVEPTITSQYTISVSIDYNLTTNTITSISLEAD